MSEIEKWEGTVKPEGETRAGITNPPLLRVYFQKFSCPLLCRDLPAV